MTFVELDEIIAEEMEWYANNPIYKDRAFITLRSQVKIFVLEQMKRISDATCREGNTAALMFEEMSKIVDELV